MNLMGALRFFCFSTNIQKGTKAWWLSAPSCLSLLCSQLGGAALFQDVLLGDGGGNSNCQPSGHKSVSLIAKQRHGPFPECVHVHACALTCRPVRTPGAWPPACSWSSWTTRPWAHPWRSRLHPLTHKHTLTRTPCVPTNKAACGGRGFLSHLPRCCGASSPAQLLSFPNHSGYLQSAAAPSLSLLWGCSLAWPAGDEDTDMKRRQALISYTVLFQCGAQNSKYKENTVGFYI